MLGLSVRVSNVSPARCHVAPLEYHDEQGLPSSEGVNGMLWRQFSCPSGQANENPQRPLPPATTTQRGSQSTSLVRRSLTIRRPPSSTARRRAPRGTAR